MERLSSRWDTTFVWRGVEPTVCGSQPFFISGKEKSGGLGTPPDTDAVQHDFHISPMVTGIISQLGFYYTFNDR